MHSLGLFFSDNVLGNTHCLQMTGEQFECNIMLHYLLLESWVQAHEVLMDTNLL